MDGERSEPCVRLVFFSVGNCYKHSNPPLNMDGYGTTTVFCVRCEKKRKMYGWLPTARQIWHLDEGLECCNNQTVIIKQEEEE